MGACNDEWPRAGHHGGLGRTAGRGQLSRADGVRAGGGGGGAAVDGTTTGAGGTGGGGAGGNFDCSNNSVAGTANTGGGGGGAGGKSTMGPQNTICAAAGSAGGSGAVILKIADADYTGTTSGSPAVDTSTDANFTYLTYTGSGTYTA